MKISSAVVGFNNQHEKQIQESTQQVLSESRQDLFSRREGDRLISSGVTVDLSYNARIRSEFGAQVNSVSHVKSADEELVIQQNYNVHSLVEKVINQSAHLEQSLGLRIGPVIPLNANGFSIQAFEDVQQLSISGDAVVANAELATIDLTQLNISTASIQIGEEARFNLIQQHVYKEEESMRVASQGRVTTEDGREINFMLELDMERSYELEESLEKQRLERTLIDPLVINLSGGVAGLTNSSFSFDLNADGTEEDISFVTQGSGFLALDINEDGVINDGSELFGTQGQSGFSHLAKYDGDGNKWIDENDEIFSKLKVWTRDEQGNDQLISLKEAGVGAIHLGSTSSQFDLTDSDNNLLGQVKRTGVFLTEEGGVASIQELDIAVHANESNTPAGSQLAEKMEEERLQFEQGDESVAGSEGSAEWERDEDERSFIERLMDIPPEDQKVAVESETIVAGERSESSNKLVIKTSADEEGNTREFLLDSESYASLERLSVKTEIQLAQERDSYDYLRDIIDTLRHATRQDSR